MFKDFFKSLITKWKTVLGYALAQLFGTYPLLYTAYEQMVANPTKETILNFGIQLLIALGVGHKVLKNIGVASKDG